MCLDLVSERWQSFLIQVFVKDTDISWIKMLPQGISFNMSVFNGVCACVCVCVCITTSCVVLYTYAHANLHWISIMH